MNFRTIVSGSPATLLALLFASLVANATFVAPARASEYVRETGYVTVRDGETQLKYTLIRPPGDGPFPTLLVYQGYGHSDMFVEGYLKDRVVEGAYAALIVSVRGSGCSGGSWQLLNPQEAEDGVDVIDWITAQPWSNKRVALAGGSYAAMTQFAVAAEWAAEYPDRDDGLVAMAPQSSVGDIYRDIAYPGGIPNLGLGVGFLGFQGANSHLAAAMGATVDAPADPVCLANQSNRAESARHNVVAHFGLHPWDDELYQRSPIYLAEKVDVPLFGFFAWQDGVLSGRAVNVLSHLDVPFHAIVTNGDHASYSTAAAVLPWRDFLDYYVRGIDNGYGNEPRLQVWWESDAKGAPSFVSSFADWPAPQAKATRYYLSQGGVLQEEVGTGGADTFVYSPSSQVPLKPHTWRHATPHPALVEAYTSEPLPRDLAVLGPASLDLSLSSTSDDADLQGTIIELRPDGKEVYVQAGWLRASHRQLDLERSTDTRPYQTHRQADQRFLRPGEATQVRLEIFPFGHVFRAGSRIKIEIGGPTFVPDNWRLGTLPEPAIDSIHHSGELQSSLVLSVLPGHPADAPLPECGRLRGQPCR